MSAQACGPSVQLRGWTYSTAHADAEAPGALAVHATGQGMPRGFRHCVSPQAATCLPESEPRASTAPRLSAGPHMSPAGDSPRRGAAEGDF